MIMKELFKGSFNTLFLVLSVVILPLLPAVAGALVLYFCGALSSPSGWGLMLWFIGMWLVSMAADGSIAQSIKRRCEQWVNKYFGEGVICVLQLCLYCFLFRMITLSYGYTLIGALVSGVVMVVYAAILKNASHFPINYSFKQCILSVKWT